MSLDLHQGKRNKKIKIRTVTVNDSVENLTKIKCFCASTWKQTGRTFLKEHFKGQKSVLHDCTKLDFLNLKGNAYNSTNCLFKQEHFILFPGGKSFFIWSDWAQSISSQNVFLFCFFFSII